MMMMMSVVMMMAINMFKMDVERCTTRSKEYKEGKEEKWVGIRLYDYYFPSSLLKLMALHKYPVTSYT